MRQTIALAGGFTVTCDLESEWSGVTGTDYALPVTFEVAHPGTDRGPRLQVTFAMRDGVATCVAVEVSAAGNGREVRNSDLRGVPSIDQLAEVAIEVLAGEVERDEAGRVVAVALRAETSTARQAFARSVRADAPRQRPPVDLAEVAKVYEDNLDNAPTLAVASHFGVTRGTASGYAARAREAGYLRAVSTGGRPRKDDR